MLPYLLIVSLAIYPGHRRFTCFPGVYFRTKRYQDAEKCFKEAVKIKLDYGEAHFNLALTYVALGNRKAALDQYNKLKKVDPKLADDFFQRHIKQ